MLLCLDIVLFWPVSKVPKSPKALTCNKIKTCELISEYIGAGRNQIGEFKKYPALNNNVIWLTALAGWLESSALWDDGRTNILKPSHRT